jgi:hypothetical protein
LAATIKRSAVPSRARVALFAVPAVSIAPASDEPLVRVSVTLLSLSATTSPVRLCPVPVSTTVPPLDPLVPHCPAAALIRTPLAALTFTPDRVITPVELVT